MIFGWVVFDWKMRSACFGFGFGSLGSRLIGGVRVDFGGGFFPFEFMSFGSHLIFLLKVRLSPNKSSPVP